MSELLRQVPALAYLVTVLAALLYGGVIGFGYGMVWERWFRERFDRRRAGGTGEGE